MAWANGSITGDAQQQRNELGAVFWIGAGGTEHNHHVHQVVALQCTVHRARCTEGEQELLLRAGHVDYDVPTGQEEANSCTHGYSGSNH